MKDLESNIGMKKWMPKASSFEDGGRISNIKLAHLCMSMFISVNSKRWQGN